MVLQLQQIHVATAHTKKCQGMTTLQQLNRTPNKGAASDDGVMAPVVVVQQYTGCGLWLLMMD
jgi:hypothetical protein